ncbi:MAG TPA: ATP-binding protein [Patescibacteria group bacterium]|nr:ATP-binding protein [Patescibacteria group bacterium]
MVIEREIYSKIKPVIKSAEAIIITGMRRTGKTTLLRFIWDTVKSENKLFLDLENPANQKFFEEKNYEKILDNLKFLGLSAKTKSYVFLDEIQFVRNIPSVIKYLIDHHGIKFFLSGSSSFYLKNLFSESLAGRKYIFELFPLSFREFLALKNPNLLLPKTDEKVSEAIFEEINRYYDEYLLYGGFPGVVRKESIEEKKMALEEIFSSYFQLEIRQLGDFRKIDVIRDLILLLMQRTGSKLDIQKLSKELGVARETIYHYLSFLEHTYFIALIRPWSRNRDTEIRSMPKFYLCDTGLINQFAKVSDGALFENAVFAALRKKGEVNYYQRKSGVEIDFILEKKYGYEVKTAPNNYDLRRLDSLSKEIGLRRGQIVARKYAKINKNIAYGFLL